MEMERVFRRDKGTGSIYQRGNIFWIKYHKDGKPYYESSHSPKKEAAQKLLNRRLGEIEKGEVPGIHFDKVTFVELATDFLTDYRINQKDTIGKAERSVKYLEDVFKRMKAKDISTAKVTEYIDRRMKAGMSNASINRELAALKRMFHIAAQCTPPKVSMVPYIPMLKENNVRKGFLEHGEYLALKDALPDHLKAVVTFAYHSAWRKSEILDLTWDRVDLNKGIARLDPGETKNEEGRILYLDDELMGELRRIRGDRRLGCPYVFQRNGRPIKDFRGSWGTACIKAGICEVKKDDEGNPVVSKNKKGKERAVKVPTKIFHDFRRTAIRDMIRSGVPERVAMTISGHKTRSVFDRYNIVSDQDLREAARKRQAYHDSQDLEPSVSETKKGEVIDFKRARNE